MKRKTRIRINKVVSTLLTLALVLCQVCFLSACGKEDVERNKARIEEELPDNMDASDVVDMLESGMSVDEVIDKVEEIKEGEEETTDKPAEATASPEPTAVASPTSTATPEPTSTPSPSPEPTPEPHVHEYVETITRKATCAEPGEKQLVCQGCGDSKTEAIPATGEHNWEPIYQTIVHQSTGHVESVEKQIQVGTSEPYTIYACGACGDQFDDLSTLQEHKKSFIGVDNVHAGANTIAYDYPAQPIYETVTESVWIVDVPETTTQELVGYKCSVCGATK